MPIIVRLPGPLREYAGGASTLTFDATRATTVAALLRALDDQWPAVGRRITDEQGAIRRHVHIYVGEELTRNTADAIADGAEVTILPAVSGG